MTSITTPSNLRPAMPSNSSTTLNTSDHRQSARNRQAKARSRRTSSRVGYRSSSAAILAVPGVFRTRNMPQLWFVIESKKHQPRMDTDEFKKWVAGLLDGWIGEEGTHL